MSASLVLLMTPGLALFYGGMAGNRHVLNMMMSFGALALVPVLYVLWGWSMSYAGSSLAGIVGNPFEAWGGCAAKSPGPPPSTLPAALVIPTSSTSVSKIPSPLFRRPLSPVPSPAA